MVNYVWKAELQKNGNIHFHLTTDIFIHYMLIRREWNNAISKLGYIERYAQTHSQLTFDEYNYYRSQQGSSDIEKNKKAYSYGLRTNWRSPNTTDVKSVKNVKSLSAYLAKYLTKEAGDKEKTGIFADSLRSLTGRLWFCSRTISNLKNVKLDLNKETKKVIYVLNKIKAVRKYYYQYAEVFFYNIYQFPPNLREWFRQELVSFAIESGYQFAAGYPKH